MEKTKKYLEEQLKEADDKYWYFFDKITIIDEKIKKISMDLSTLNHDKHSYKCELAELNSKRNELSELLKEFNNK